MRETLRTFKREWRFLLAVGLVSAVLTTLLVFAIAGITSGPSQALANRVDSNAAITRSGVDSIVCILAIPPEQRTDENITSCMATHGYLPYFTAPQTSG